jgi:hypothetical protein
VDELMNHVDDIDVALAKNHLHYLRHCLLFHLTLPNPSMSPHVSTCLQFGGQAAHDDWVVFLSPLTMSKSEIADVVLDRSFEGAEHKSECTIHVFKLKPHITCTI